MKQGNARVGSRRGLKTRSRAAVRGKANEQEQEKHHLKKKQN